MRDNIIVLKIKNLTPKSELGYKLRFYNKSD